MKISELKIPNKIIVTWKARDKTVECDNHQSVTSIRQKLDMYCYTELNGTMKIQQRINV